MTNKALIVDDDPLVLGALEKVVRTIRMEPCTAASGEEALALVKKNSYDVILMDINLSGMDGFEAVRAIRVGDASTPIIIVSGRKEDFDTLYGLDIGADDYVTKPFNPVTLGAKIKAILRRSNAAAGSQTITAGPFTYNTATLRMYKNGGEIYLSAKENSIMRLFLDNVNRIFSKEALYELVWGNDVVYDNAIVVYINRLRNQIEDDPAHPRFIQTVRGLGYRFVV